MAPHLCLTTVLILCLSAARSQMFGGSSRLDVDHDIDNSQASEFHHIVEDKELSVKANCHIRLIVVSMRPFCIIM